MGTRDLEKLLDVIESNVGRVEKRLDRIEQLIRDQAIENTSGRRVDLKRWTSSVATKVGIRLLGTLANAAVPKNGELPQAARKEGVQLLTHYPIAGALLEVLETCRVERSGSR